MARVDVVILNWNGERHLRRFLPSVVAHTDGAGIYVADNGSDDGSVEMLRRDFPSVGIIELDRNYGFAEGYDRALADPVFSDTRYFVLLNSDVEVGEGWLGPLVDSLDMDPGLFAVSPKILSFTEPGRFEYAGAAGGFIDRLGYPFCRGRILSTVEEDEGQYDTTREVFWASGACMAVRASAFVELGGFDPMFFAHMEEIDLCWRARRAGWKIITDVRSRVYHLGGGTLSVDSPRKLYLNFRNNLYMLRKNLRRGERAGVITLRMIADGFSAAVYLLSLRPKAFAAVWKAHRDYSKNKKRLDAGSSLPQVKFTSLPGVYRGSIILRYISGKKRFGTML